LHLAVGEGDDVVVGMLALVVMGVVLGAGAGAVFNREGMAQLEVGKV
jgi:hypothetical protein